jgi:hypothetical protein
MTLVAVVFLVTVGGAYYAGYRMGLAEGGNVAPVVAASAAPADMLPGMGNAAVDAAGPASADGAAESDTAVAQRFFADAGAQTISGEITLDDALRQKLGKDFAFRKDDVLFVIATRADLGPQPLAVTRLDHLEGRKLPLRFEIGPGDLMTQDRGAFTGDLNLKVKLSHSGDAKTSPGDLLGSPVQASAVRPGAKGVRLQLNAVAAG